MFIMLCQYTRQPYILRPDARAKKSYKSNRTDIGDNQTKSVSTISQDLTTLSKYEIAS